MVTIRQLGFNEWIKPLRLSSQILKHTPQPEKTLLLLKLPISLLVVKLYNLETIYVAEDKDEIIGICLAQLHGDRLLIEGTVVAKEYRRRGISHRLKKAIETRAKQLGATKAITKIEPSNTPAIKMAKRQGYVKTKPKYYEKSLN